MTRMLDKIFGDSLKGLSYARNDLLRNLPFTNKFQNLMVNSAEEAQKRNGFQLFSRYSVHSTDPSDFRGLSSVLLRKQDGTLDEELLCWSADPADDVVKLHRIKPIVSTGDRGVKVTYNGMASEATFQLIVNSSGEWECTLKEDGAILSGWPKTYGTGLEATPDLVSDLKTDIDAESDWLMILDETAYIPVGALPIIPEREVTLFGFSSVDNYDPDGFLEYGAFEVVETGAGAVSNLVPYTQEITEASFTNPNTATLNNVTYFGRDQQESIQEATGIQLFKYDGYNCYRSGMPDCEIDSVTDGSAGSVFDANGVYKYRIRSKRIDNQDNVIFSDLTAEFSHTVGGSNVASLDMLCGLESSVQDEFLFRYARVNGTQSDTTITVDSGHTFQAGDTAYVLHSGTLTTRTVASVTATTITFTSTISVSDNEIFSNITLEIYRTIKDGLLYYFVDEVPFLATGALAHDYSDTSSDTTIQGNGDLIEPEIARTPPPPARFVCEHQGLLIMAGVPGDEQSVYVSDISNPEYVPRTNTINVSSSGRGNVNGVSSDGERLFIFKEKAYVIIHGNLGVIDPGQPPDIFVEERSYGIGCVAHDTIRLGRDGLYFLSYSGPQRFVDGVLDREFSARLTSYFRDLVDNDERLVVQIRDSWEDKVVFKHCTATYDPLRNMYLLAVAIETGEEGSVDGGTYLFSSQVKLFCYEELLENDLGDRWYEWTSDLAVLGGTGGLAVFEDRFVVAGAFNPPGSVATRGYICREIRRNDKYKFADNCNAIDALYHTPWENFDNPSTLKEISGARVWRAQRTGNVGGTYQVRVFSELVDPNDTDNAYNSFTLDFTADATTQQENDFTMLSLFHILVSLQNATLHEDLRFTALELSYLIDAEGGELEDAP